MSSSGTATWRELFAEASVQLGSADEARWLCQEASGLDGAAWATNLDAPATEATVARLDTMVARRRAGEPLQYVLGRWAFRHLDLLVDRRVLIPRSETEQLVDLALGFVWDLPRPVVLADLGTGSGAIALALASELPLEGVTVWASDRSERALGVAQANLAGIGRAAMNVRLGAGSWYDALPAELSGRLDLVASNPPYVADGDPAVEDVVSSWEPAEALLGGEDGLDSVRAIVEGAPRWLRARRALVCEIGTGQGDAAVALAESAGLVDVRVERDLAGHDRFLVAWRAADGSAP